MTITIERAQANEETFCDVFELLLELHKVGGYAPLDEEKAIARTYEVLEHETVFIARNKDGKAVGTLGLHEVKFWYSDTSYLQDAWFFVLPRYRRGKAGVLLLRAAREEAEQRNLLALLTVNNPDRRPKKTKSTVLAQVAGYVPLGYTLKIG